MPLNQFSLTKLSPTLKVKYMFSIDVRESGTLQMFTGNYRVFAGFPCCGLPCNIYRLWGNPIIIMGFPRNLQILQGLSTTYIGFLCDSYSPFP